MMDGLKIKYFVLSPQSTDVAFALASRAAMLEFAAHIRKTSPELAADLHSWVDDCDLLDEGGGNAR